VRVSKALPSGIPRYQFFPFKGSFVSWIYDSLIFLTLVDNFPSCVLPFSDGHSTFFFFGSHSVESLGAVRNLLWLSLQREVFGIIPPIWEALFDVDASFGSVVCGLSRSDSSPFFGRKCGFFSFGKNPKKDFLCSIGGCSPPRRRLKHNFFPFLSSLDPFSLFFF